ncbi:hypothetical protein [Cupriavidus pinatubonensis]|uniref:hypothetical protein n=1 Tax=Cupriavidus pinatubonensis TaxID=248026 RepID=UPI00112D2984|nr:hypothetical protein [Cupriavidus pinatubonensis]TPQ30014.1 hypothetical protein C2U69_31970 [Cupriavidus pinatubonensis]
MMMTSTTLDRSGLHREFRQRLATAAVASAERLDEEISQAFATIDLHLQSPRRAGWGADCEWLLSGLQNSCRTALDLLVYTGYRTEAESEGIQRRLMTTIHLARLQAQAAGDTVAPIVAASRITSLIERAKEESASFYDHLRAARTAEHEPRYRGQ